MAVATCGCGRQWSGLSQCHCASGCHEHFGSVRGFDEHRRTGHCQHPATVTRRDGRPWFKADTSRYGVTWVRDNPQGHYRTQDDAA